MSEVTVLPRLLKDYRIDQRLLEINTSPQHQVKSHDLERCRLSYAITNKENAILAVNGSTGCFSVQSIGLFVMAYDKRQSCYPCLSKMRVIITVLVAFWEPVVLSFPLELYLIQNPLCS